MPKLRETRLQIQEGTARETRQRTAARVAALYKEEEDVRQAVEDVSQAVERERVVQEDTADEGLPRECERYRRFEAVCFRLQCKRLVVIFLFFVYCLYHAYKT
jgi:hypothetical protein